MNLFYWAIQFGDSYRVTSKRFEDKKQAAVDLWGMYSERMVCIPFNQHWRSMSAAYKSRVVAELKVTK